MPRTPNPDQRADQLAARQHGVISLAQALAVGLTRRQVEWRLKTRRWLDTARAVYRVAAAPVTWYQDAMIACLAGPAGTVASHLTAAALFGLTDPPRPPHVIVPPGTSGRAGQAVVHRIPLDPRDTCTVVRIPSTTPARALVDCAALVSLERLCHLVDRAFCRSVSTPGRVRRVLAQGGRRLGVTQLEEAMAVWTPGPFFGSPAEARLLRQLERWGVPRPERQYRIYDEDGLFVARVDLALPAWRFGLEYYGEEFHGPRQWETDDLRQDRIEALGWRIEPVDKFDLRPSSTRLRDLLLPLLKAA